jgi:hypothetical protein
MVEDEVVDVALSTSWGAEVKLSPQKPDAQPMRMVLVISRLSIRHGRT